MTRRTRPEPNNAVVHFYRAAVVHADVWRQRSDVTTNWAVVTSAAVLSLGFTQSQTPHFVMLLSVGFLAMFLLMESRRYQAFHIWHKRIRVLQQHIFVPELHESSRPPARETEAALAKFAREMGDNVPTLALWQAMGYRLRRSYGLLALIATLAWFIKLWVHPHATGQWQVVCTRAALGPVRGEWVFAGLGGAAVAMVLWGLMAPTEEMLEWQPVPSPLGKWRRKVASGLRRRRGRSHPHRHTRPEPKPQTTNSQSSDRGPERWESSENPPPVG